MGMVACCTLCDRTRESSVEGKIRCKRYSKEMDPMDRCDEFISARMDEYFKGSEELLGRKKK